MISGLTFVVDRYRQYVGPAHLAEKRIISCELGAVILEVYEFTLRSLLRLTNRAFAAGINMMVFHGSPFSYKYPNTTWPGFASFDYNFAEMHSRHQPAWEHGYREFMDAVARTQFIQQSGTPKIDLAFWDKPTSSAMIADLNNLTELISAGMSTPLPSRSARVVLDVIYKAIPTNIFRPKIFNYRKQWSLMECCLHPGQRTRL